MKIKKIISSCLVFIMLFGVFEMTNSKLYVLANDSEFVGVGIASASERLIPNADIIRNIGFGNNVSDTCGPIAAAILLTYYAKVENLENLLHNNGEILMPPDKTADDRLSDLLINNTQFNPIIGGTLPSTLAAGINKYLKADSRRRGTMASATVNSTAAITANNIWHLLSRNPIRKSIDNGRPVIIYAMPIPENERLNNRYEWRKIDDWHAMVAYGYDTSDNSFIVHTGWWDGNEPIVDVKIGAGYVFGAVTLSSGTMNRRIAVGKRLNLNSHITKLKLAAKPASENEWISDDESIATVNQKGRVIAKNTPGNVTITHRNKVTGEETSFDIEVIIPIRRLRITPLAKAERNNITVGSELQLSATFAPENTTERRSVKLIKLYKDIIKV